MPVIIRRFPAFVFLLALAASAVLYLSNAATTVKSGGDWVLGDSSRSPRTSRNPPIVGRTAPALSVLAIPMLKSPIYSGTSRRMRICIDGLQWVTSPFLNPEKDFRIRFKVQKSDGSNAQFVVPNSAISMIANAGSSSFSPYFTSVIASHVNGSGEWYADLPNLDPRSPLIHLAFKVRDPGATSTQSGKCTTEFECDDIKERSGDSDNIKPGRNFTTPFGTNITLSGYSVSPGGLSEQPKINLDLVANSSKVADLNYEIVVRILDSRHSRIADMGYICHANSPMPECIANYFPQSGANTNISTPLSFQITAIESSARISTAVLSEHFRADINLAVEKIPIIKHTAGMNDVLSLGNAKVECQLVSKPLYASTGRIIWIKTTDRNVSWRAVDFRCGDSINPSVRVPIDVDAVYWHNDGTPLRPSESGEYASVNEPKDMPMVFALQAYTRNEQSISYTNIKLPQIGQRMQIDQPAASQSNSLLTLTAISALPTAPINPLSNPFVYHGNQLQLEFRSSITRASSQDIIINSAHDNIGNAIQVPPHLFTSSNDNFETSRQPSSPNINIYTPMPAPGAMTYSFSGKYEVEHPTGPPHYILIDSTGKLHLLDRRQQLAEIQTLY
jgi:hypothetical protein